MRDDKLLTRIAGLLRQAENTDNEHEAETFMQAAQRLATSASIDLAVARAHDPAARRKTTPITRQVAIGETGKRGLRTYVQLFVAIARANDVTVDVAGNNTFVLAYGYEADIDTCEALYTSLLIQMVAASDGYLRSGDYRGETSARVVRKGTGWRSRELSRSTASARAASRASVSRTPIRSANADWKFNRAVIGASGLRSTTLLDRQPVPLRTTRADVSPR